MACVFDEMRALEGNQLMSTIYSNWNIASSVAPVWIGPLMVSAYLICCVAFNALQPISCKLNQSLPPVVNDPRACFAA